MSDHNRSSVITLSRSAIMLRTGFGSDIAGFLDDPNTVEVMLNPDGRLWVDRLGSGLSDTGCSLSASIGERIIRLVADHVGLEVHAAAPRLPAATLAEVLNAIKTHDIAF